MLSRPDPLIFRSAAFAMAVAVVGVDKVLGNTFLASLATITAVIVGSFIFPARSPRNKLRRVIHERLIRIGWERWYKRLVLATGMMVGAAVLNNYVAGDLLGQEYSLFLIVVFLASLLLGMQIAIVVWLLSFLWVYYSVVPPKNSFEIGSVKDFADLIGYFYLGLIMLAIAVLIRVSSAPEEPQ